MNTFERDNFIFFPANSFTPPISPARDKTLHCGLIPAATPVGGRLAVWLVDSMPMLEGLQKDLKLIGQNIVHLSKIADQISSSLAASVTDQEVWLIIHF